MIQTLNISTKLSLSYPSWLHVPGSSEWPNLGVLSVTFWRLSELHLVDQRVTWKKRFLSCHYHPSKKRGLHTYSISCLSCCSRDASNSFFSRFPIDELNHSIQPWPGLQQNWSVKVPTVKVISHRLYLLTSSPFQHQPNLFNKLGTKWKSWAWNISAS